jgi:hypothetical protein
VFDKHTRAQATAQGFAEGRFSGACRQHEDCLRRSQKRRPASQEFLGGLFRA